MRGIPLLFILLSWACVDRINLEDFGGEELRSAEVYGMVVDGFISDQPGPYTVSVNTSFDPESSRNIKNPVSELIIDLSDNAGNSERLTEISPGTYQTRADGIRGTTGRAYTLTILTPDGQIGRAHV